MILFEDAQIVVCVKPAGLSAQKSADGRDLITRLIAETGAPAIFPVHRLDRETAGVMVYAKTAKAAAALSAQIAAKTFEKRYYAVLTGCPAALNGTLEDLLFHDRQRNKTYVVKRERKGVKKAVLDYGIRAQADGLSLAEVRLRTGRTHQIRVQFAARQLPLCGDGKYGGGSGVLGLFAYALAFDHPVTGARLAFHALPDLTAAPWDRFAAQGVFESEI